MPWHKRLMRSSVFRTIACWLAAQYIRFVYYFSRWDVRRGDIPARFWEEDEPFILAFWHGQILMMPYCWHNWREMRMLISQHRDGELITRTIAHFGLGTIRGSAGRGGKAKGGVAALRAMVRALGEDVYVGITPDGPRGPRMRAGSGAIAVARLSGAPIVPVASASSKRYVVNSWDRFIVNLPFSRGVFVWGEPLYVDRDADEAALEQARAALEREMNALSAEANEIVGQDPIEPGPPLPAPNAPDPEKTGETA